MLRAGEVLGLPRRIGVRELDRLVRDLPLKAQAVEERIETENAGHPGAVGVFLGGERRVVATIKHLIVREMVERLAPAQ